MGMAVVCYVRCLMVELGGDDYKPVKDKHKLYPQPYIIYQSCLITNKHASRQLIVQILQHSASSYQQKLSEEVYN